MLSPQIVFDAPSNNIRILRDDGSIFVERFVGDVDVLTHWKKIFLHTSRDHNVNGSTRQACRSAADTIQSIMESRSYLL
jgi:hypothetical protein